ncbi:MAG TPA: hypothetical protein VFR35_20465 [Actinoplanes sp.]|nr:hypothetical protein [Actinoplanes sp.]
MPQWILVPCLVALRNEFDRLAPHRDRLSDGSIGDSAHRWTPSDHNPDETGLTPTEDPDRVNEVHAIDVDRDLRKPGWSMQKCVEVIVVRHRRGQDDRLQNVIYERRIWSRSWGWTARAYNGANPHTRHAHFSSRYDTPQERDVRPWGLLEAEDDDMATITQTDFNARMDAWWNARMSPTAKDNPQRAALRVAPWQQTVGGTTKSTHNMLFGDMLALLRTAAEQNPQAVAELVLAGMDYQAIATAVVGALAAPDRSTEETAAALRTALGDRAGEIGRLLAA